MTQYIACAQYDYFEIACMHHYEVKLTLKNSATITGIAQNVHILKSEGARKEILTLTANDETLEVELISIHKMQALHSNPHFEEVTLS